MRRTCLADQVLEQLKDNLSAERNTDSDKYDMVLNGGFRRVNFFQLACFCIFYFAMEVNYNLRFQYIALVLGPLDNSEIFLHLSNFYHDLYLGNYHWATYSF